MKYRTIRGKNFTFVKTTSKCLKCNYEKTSIHTTEFDYYESVDFLCSDGKQRFLPIYGKNGYLELIEKVYGKERVNKGIIEPMYREFIKILSKYCPYDLDSTPVWHQCDNCKSGMEILREKTVKESSVLWLEVDIDSFYRDFSENSL